MDLLNVLFLFGLITGSLIWLIPDKFQKAFLILISFSFLSLYAPLSAAILAVTTVSSYFVFRLATQTVQATLLIIIQNLILIAFFKLNWYDESLSLIDQNIPLGLSFYTFRQIHYAIEQYKEKLLDHTFIDYTAYMSFLPTILIGPINRFSPFLRNLYRRRWDASLFSEGLERILFGYIKVVVIGNYVLNYQLADYVQSLADLDHWLWAYLKILNFTLITYFQFAGFSDVAIGLALLFGFRVMENFNHPFFAVNISDFWKRWHISLSSWCRDYVYTPIASISRKPLLGIVMSMLAIGLWHEISLKYILWGLFHGFGILIWYQYRKSKLADFLRRNIPGYRFLSIAMTFHFVLMSFVIIMEDDWSSVVTIYGKLFLIN